MKNKDILALFITVVVAVLIILLLPTVAYSLLNIEINQGVLGAVVAVIGAMIISNIRDYNESETSKKRRNKMGWCIIIASVAIILTTSAWPLIFNRQSLSETNFMSSLGMSALIVVAYGVGVGGVKKKVGTDKESNG